MTKTCTKCGNDKSIGEFHKTGRQSKRIKSWCKSCTNSYSRSYYKKRCARDPIYRSNQCSNRRRNYLKRVYSLTSEEYSSLLVRQNHCCAICGRDRPTGGQANFSVDHDHKTGAIRGLLCDPCNQAIGLLKDNPAIAESLADYLRTSQQRALTCESI